DFFRHAVRAAQVAAVGDADAQVVVRAAEGVDQLARHGLGSSPPWCCLGERQDDSPLAPVLGGEGAAPCKSQPPYPRPLSPEYRGRGEKKAFRSSYPSASDDRDRASPVPGWTHSVVPSAQCSFFQIGTSSLSRSMAWRHASKASARCGQLTATATLTSPTSSRPSRWTRPMAPTGQRARVSAAISAIFFSAMPGYAS